MKRERITITIDTSLLPAVDRLVNGVTIRNRSHALEVAVKRGLHLTSLRALFLVLDEENALDAGRISHYIEALSIPKLYTFAPLSRQTAVSELLDTLTAKITLDHTALPYEFGDAAALALACRSEGTILVVTPSSEPLHTSTLNAALMTHRESGKAATQVIRTHGTRLSSAGLYFIESSLVTPHLSQATSLSSDVFPTLAGLGNLGVYAF